MDPLVALMRGRGNGVYAGHGDQQGERPFNRAHIALSLFVETGDLVFEKTQLPHRFPQREEMVGGDLSLQGRQQFSQLVLQPPPLCL